jgi:hypothetical protein
MSFRFRVGKVWHHPQRQVCDVIGVLEDGVILPPVMAKINEYPGESLRIESIALGGGKPLTGKQEELTLVVGYMSVQPQVLEGCLLLDS